MSRSPQQNEFVFFTRNLLKWYHAHGRDLPWRRTADPYAIWISEIMLQQTQVATVLPYYARFLSRFPTLRDLAAAPLDKVLKSWEGLGYYARARHLHRAANEMVARFEGNFPSRFEEILSLPGIGRSTAGAIATIALGQRHPILDGNVKRVLCRYFCVEEDPKKKETEKQLWQFSEKLLPRKEPDHYTQAIMDLGATICTPAEPRCPLCPVRNQCKAFEKGVQGRLPMKALGKRVPERDYVAGVLFRGKRVLIRRRPAKGLLGGLWEFPGGQVDLDGKGRSVEKKITEALRKEIPWRVDQWSPWGKVKHTFTHFKMTLHVYSGRSGERQGQNTDEQKWVDVEALSDYAFSSAHQKILLKLKEPTDGQRRLFS
ncbi:MAG: A/G-specific adenine glycosylase [Candidatus Manganitrophaceae bacterium]|nr:MAG: A/G-specific adenine glycosylase [Candidatus Manganitrophaceae bacterium]